MCLAFIFCLCVCMWYLQTKAVNTTYKKQVNYWVGIDLVRETSVFNRNSGRIYSLVEAQITL